jgi:cell division protein FtsL
MVMVKASAAISARARARQAKAELDAQRAEEDRLIVDAATEFYEAAEALEAAQTAAAAAEQLRMRSVTRLVELGQSDTQISTLCGIAAKQVRDLRRSAAQASPTDAPKPSQRPAADGGTAEPGETAAA